MSKIFITVFNYGNIHFIALDTESIYDITMFSNEQKEWLEKDLASVDRSATPWIIAYAHRPFYCSGVKECDDNPLVLEEAIILLNKYRVDLVITAHRHNYERMWPIDRNGNPVKSYTDPGAPVYLVNGAGGNREGTDGFGGKFFPGSLVRISQWGYGLIQVFNDTHLEYTFFSDSNKVLDDFMIINHH